MEGEIPPASANVRRDDESRQSMRSTASFREPEDAQEQFRGKTVDVVWVTHALMICLVQNNNYQRRVNLQRR